MSLVKYLLPFSLSFIKSHNKLQIQGEILATNNWLWRNLCGPGLGGHLELPLKMLFWQQCVVIQIEMGWVQVINALRILCDKITTSQLSHFPQAVHPVILSRSFFLRPDLMQDQINFDCWAKEPSPPAWVGLTWAFRLSLSDFLQDLVMQFLMENEKVVLPVKCWAFKSFLSLTAF